MLRHLFRAMGTEVDCLLVSEDETAPAALQRVEDEFRRLERLLSRFLEDSQLSRLNREGSIEAGEDLMSVVELALEARERTGGRFDPTVHDALVSAGYDRTFSEVAADGQAVSSAAACGGEVYVDRSRAVVSLAEGTRLDLGGIGKGYAVDRTCDLLCELGPCLVNAGGDLAVRGLPPEHGLWPVGLETPAGPMTVGLTRGALATSGRDKRRWRRGGRELHHVIDPATGAPCDTDLLRATAIAPTAVEAEVAAKCLLMAGEENAVSAASEQGLACVLVTADDRVVTVGLGSP
jgi:thiamine biosynthesis lipoprotein